MHPNHATLNGITKCWCPQSLVKLVMGARKPWGWDTFECIPQNLGVMRKKNVDLHTMCSSFSVAVPCFIHVFTWILHFQHQHLSWPTLSISSLSIPLSLHLCCTLLLCLSLLSTDPMACPSHPPSPLLSVCVWHNEEKGASFVQCQPCFQWALAQMHHFSLLII